MKRRLFSRVLLGLLLAGWLAGAGPRPARAARPEDQLRQLRKKIQQEEKVVRDIKQKQTSILGSLEDMDKRIVVFQKDLRVAHKKNRETQRQIQSLGLEISSLKSRIDRQRDGGARRTVSFYRFGKTGVLPVLFADRSLPEKFRDLRAMRRILEADWERLQAFYGLAREKAQKEGTLQQRLEDEKRLKEKIRKSIEEEKAARQDKDGLLFQVSRDEQLHQELLRELQGSADSLSRQIREEETLRQREEAPDELAPAPGGSLVAQKGKLAWPVEGEVSRGFGRIADPVLRVTVTNQGIDIQTRAEASVRAVWSGRVAYADWFRGYGKLMIIHHGAKSYSVVSHLSRLTRKKGDVVEPGEIVGYAGDTGALEGPMVHFEIWHEGKPSDPVRWLRAGRGARARGSRGNP